jgi:hypothetical protein
MPHPSRIIPTTLRIAEFVLLAALFAIIYAQSPLYTSNQNQYFLHGLAHNGVGFLSEDWLANTLDPTPVFTALVEWTYRLTHSTALFYVYSALLMGIYLFSVLDIVESVYPIRASRTRYLAFLALFLLEHSAALRFALARGLGVNWTYLLEDGVADQRLIGPVFQPSMVGVLLVLSIYLFLHNRPFWAVLCTTLAATVHPTYLLSAATLTLTYMILTFLDARQHKNSAIVKPILLGFVALVSVLPILVFVYTNFGDTPQATTAQARHILAYFRLPHHSLVSWWLDATAIIKIVLVVAALYLVRKSRLFLLLGVSFGVATALTVIQVLTRSDALALIFPWRLSVYLVPLSIALILGWLVTLVMSRVESQAKFLVSQDLEKQVSQAEVRSEDALSRWLQAISLAVITMVVLIGTIRLKLDFDRQTQSNEWPLMDYVARNHASGEEYLTPTKMENFRLTTGSPVYVDFKSIPYKDSDVLEWYRRLQLADRFYKQQDCSMLPGFSQEGVTHVVLEYESFKIACPQLHLLYQDERYGLYLLQFP